MKRDNEKVTDVWVEYEKGKNYNRMKNLYNNVEKFSDFYHGKQWRGAKLGGIQPITLNLIKTTVKHKVGVVNTNAYEVVFNPNGYEDMRTLTKMEAICKLLNKHISRTWELEQVAKKFREAVKDSCIFSEGITYWYEEDGNFKLEIVDKTNIYFGNENDDNIQEQPYIIISFRRTVESVKEEARANDVDEKEIENITSDQEYFEQSNSKDRISEVSPMCLVLLKLYKENGIVKIKKCTRTVTIYDGKDTNMHLYPVAHMIWEKEKGNARGIGEVEPLIDNQIEINKTATRRSMAITMGAYPKLAVNSDYVKNPSSLNKVGSIVEMSGIPTDDLSKVINYLKPASMSSDATLFQQELLSTTRELANASDIATGDADPEKASGKAILAIQQASQQPLNEQVETYRVFVEDNARIWFDMLQAYAVDGIVVMEERKDQNGNDIQVPIKITNDELTSLKVAIKIDITPQGPYDRYAQELSLENLMTQKIITFEEYVGVLPQTSAMPKPSLDKILQDRKEKEKRIQEIHMQANAMDSAIRQTMNQEERRTNIPEQKQQSVSILEGGGMQNEMSEMQTSGNVS